MGDIVNLHVVRKRAARKQAAEKAAENRVRFGRSKQERSLTHARAGKARKTLDQHRIETGDAR